MWVLCIWRKLKKVQTLMSKILSILKHLILIRVSGNIKKDKTQLNIMSYKRK